VSQPYRLQNLVYFSGNDTAQTNDSRFQVAPVFEVALYG
jgi:hypothetical protein